jgi:hypothetical protein
MERFCWLVASVRRSGVAAAAPGGDAHFQVRDFHNDLYGTSLGGWKTVPWSPLVIFDGVTCTRRAATGHLAYRIWVEAPDEIRLARGLIRDGEEAQHLWLTWMEEERDFFSNDATRDRADLLVNGAVPDGAINDEDEVLTLG